VFTTSRRKFAHILQGRRHKTEEIAQQIGNNARWRNDVDKRSKRSTTWEGRKKISGDWMRKRLT